MILGEVDFLAGAQAKVDTMIARARTASVLKKKTGLDDGVRLS
jgi:hypothetical protein